MPNGDFRPSTNGGLVSATPSPSASRSSVMRFGARRAGAGPLHHLLHDPALDALAVLGARGRIGLGDEHVAVGQHVAASAGAQARRERGDGQAAGGNRRLARRPADGRGDVHGRDQGLDGLRQLGLGPTLAASGKLRHLAAAGQSDRPRPGRRRLGNGHHHGSAEGRCRPRGASHVPGRPSDASRRRRRRLAETPFSAGRRRRVRQQRDDDALRAAAVPQQRAVVEGRALARRQQPAPGARAQIGGEQQQERAVQALVGEQRRDRRRSRRRARVEPGRRRVPAACSAKPALRRRPPRRAPTRRASRRARGAASGDRPTRAPAEPQRTPPPPAPPTPAPAARRPAGGQTSDRIATCTCANSIDAKHRDVDDQQDHRGPPRVRCRPARADRHPHAARRLRVAARRGGRSSCHSQASVATTRDDAARARGRDPADGQQQEEAGRADGRDAPAASCRRAARSGGGVARAARGDQRLAQAGRRAGQPVRGPRSTSAARPGLLPQRIARRDLRDAARAVVLGGQPFERRRAPRVAVLARGAAACATRSKASSATPAPSIAAPSRREHVRPLPAEPGVVGVHAARHAEQPGDVHRKEGEVEADERRARTPSAPSRSPRRWPSSSGSQWYSAAKSGKTMPPIST